MLVLLQNVTLRLAPGLNFDFDAQQVFGIYLTLNRQHWEVTGHNWIFSF